MVDLKIKVTPERLAFLNEEATKQGITVDDLYEIAFKKLEARITYLRAVGTYTSSDY